MDVFDAAWDQLARAGMCDERGGAEYTRCRWLWDHQVQMLAAMHCILSNANAGAPPVAPPRPNQA